MCAMFGSSGPGDSRDEWRDEWLVSPRDDDEDEEEDEEDEDDEDLDDDDLDDDDFDDDDFDDIDEDLVDLDDEYDTEDEERHRPGHNKFEE